MSSDIGIDPNIMSNLSIIFLMIVITGIFTAIETAMASSNRNKLKILAQEGNPKAEFLRTMLSEPEKIFNTIYLIQLFTILLAGGYAVLYLTLPFNDWINRHGISINVSTASIFVITTIGIIAFIFGYFYPKRVGRLHAEGISMYAAKPISVIIQLLSPVLWVITLIVLVCLTITRQKTDFTENEFYEDDVMSMLEAGQELGALKEEGKKMINSIFSFDDKLAYEVMTPRTDVFCIDITDEPEEYMDKFMELRYSRVPVYEGDTDNIIGILHVKDYLMSAKANGFENVDIKSIFCPPYFVSATKNIDSLFFDMQSTKQHIAILIDEYGGFAGIATMEDIIEQVMGDIDDEYENNAPLVEQIGEDTYSVDGFMNLDDLNEELNLHLESETSETLAGFLIDTLGEIPEENETEARIIRYENCTFTIESVKERRIERVKIHISSDREKVENDSNLNENVV